MQTKGYYVFKGLGNLGEMGGMLKKAMELKQNMEALKEQLGDEQVEASVAGGMVTVVISGKLELLSIKIDPELVDPNDLAALETIVQAGVNEGLRKAQAMVQERMQSLTGGLDIPGLAE